MCLLLYVCLHANGTTISLSSCYWYYNMCVFMLLVLVYVCPDANSIALIQQSLSQGVCVCVCVCACVCANASSLIQQSQETSACLWATRLSPSNRLPKASASCCWYYSICVFACYWYWYMCVLMLIAYEGPRQADYGPCTIYMFIGRSECARRP